MFALHKHNYSIAYGGKTTAISAVYLLKWGVFLTIAYQNALLGRDFVRSISRPPCVPGVALDAEVVTDFSWLAFPLQLLLFMAYSKENPRGKKKPTTKPVPRPQKDSQLLFLEARLREIPVCYWCWGIQDKAVCLCLRGWGWGNKIKQRRLVFQQTHLDIPQKQYSLQVQSFVLKMLYVWQLRTIHPCSLSVCYRMLGASLFSIKSLA